MRRLKVMEQDVAPARGRRTLLPLPGGAGAPLAGTMTRREELADTGANAPVESAARRRKDAAMARREAPHLREKVCTDCMTRPSARHPLDF